MIFKLGATRLGKYCSLSSQLCKILLYSTVVLYSPFLLVIRCIVVEVMCDSVF